MSILNSVERTAVEMKYLGYSYIAIAERIETPIDTIRHWFERSGKLFEYYDDFAESMEKKRKNQFEEEFASSDKEIFATTTNVMRTVAQKLLPRKVLLVNRKGQAIADENGMPQYVDAPTPDFDMTDFKTAWHIQRVMRGKPTNYERQEVDNSSANDDRIIQELGLTDEDFTDEHRLETATKISKWLSENE